MFGRSLFGAGVSNLRPRDQNQPSKDSSPAHWTAMENVKKSINFGVVTAFSYI